LLGIFEGAGIAGPFLFGYFADTWGRYKPGLISVFILLLISAIPLAVWINPVISALFLGIMAIGFRTIIPLMDAVTTINLGSGGDYGKIRTVGSASFIVMVLFLQWTPFLRPDTPLNIALWISITSLAALCSMAMIPSQYTGTGRPPPAVTPHVMKTGTNRRIWSPLFIIGLIIIALSRLAMAPVNGFLSLYVTEYIHWNAVGLVWALSSAAEVPFMYISGRIIRRFGAFRLLAFTTVAVGLRLLIYTLFPLRGGIIIAQLLHSLCYGLFHPAAISFISSCVPPERRALGMSLYLSLGTGLPTLAGNILGGYIIDHSGYRTLFGSFMGFPVLALGLYLFTSLHRKSVKN
jgi:PPP family 3-phenylpropionic acid transporter